MARSGIITESDFSVDSLALVPKYRQHWLPDGLYVELGR